MIKKTETFESRGDDYWYSKDGKTKIHSSELQKSSPSQPEWYLDKEFENFWMDNFGHKDIPEYWFNFIQKVSESSKEEGRKERTYEYLPRSFGKNTKLLVDFFTEGKKGKAVVFATPEGNFLSPKAVENELNEQRQSILKLIEGMEKSPMSINDAMEVGNPNIYNQALSDLKNLINKR